MPLAGELAAAGIAPGNATQTANATTLTSRRIMLFPSLTVPARLSAFVCRVASKVRCPVPAHFFTMCGVAVKRELKALRAMFCDIQQTRVGVGRSRQLPTYPDALTIPLCP